MIFLIVFYSVLMSSPAIVAYPLVGPIIPVSMLNKVDLPAPLCPKRHSNSFLATSRYTPLTASTSF